jgi:uncharacterized protein (TIGR02266 family)
LADPNTRQGKRTPVTLKIKFKSETLEQFIERYAVDVSQGGIFIRTKEPLAVGTQMKFEFQLRDASPLISGEGTVVWTRENDPSRPAIAPGMGVRFDRLNEGSQQVLEKILAEKAKQAPQRSGHTETTKPPLFTDTPTRVAPAPIQDQLGLGPSGRAARDSEQTPLPKPMPFHSDADEFDENAFQEATKVRSLDELAAQSAAAGMDLKTGTAIMPMDELAERRKHSRAETPLAEPPAPGVGPGIDERSQTIPDRDSAPGLPEPPERDTSRPHARKLDTSPSPRTEGDSPRTMLGVEPAKVVTSSNKIEATERVAVPRAVFPLGESETSRPIAPKRPSIAPIVIGALVLVAGALGAVYYFVIRPSLAEDQRVVTNEGTKPNPQPVTQPGSGSALLAATGSGSSAPEVKPAPAAPTVDTVIAASVPKATIEIEGTDQRGDAPFTAKLEKDKAYKVHVHAAGFLGKDLDVKGGQDKVTAKLEAKPHMLAVTSAPPGAQVWIDGFGTGKATPADIRLTAAQAAKTKLRVVLRKPGYRAAEVMFDATTATEDDAQVSGTAEARLVVMPVVINNGGTGAVTHPTGAGAGSAAAAGSGAPAAGSGSDSGTAAGSAAGSAAGTGTGSGSGSGSDAKPETKPDVPATPDQGAKGSGEPEPDWSKRQ